MKSNELLKILECIGPLSLSEEFQKKCSCTDNSGIIINCGEDIKGVLFSLDFSRGALDETKKRGFNAIVTHHPAIFGGINSISVDDHQTSLIAECVRWGITVISMHLNFDAAPEGIDYFLMRGLGGEAADTHIKLSGGAYGRIYEVNPRSFGDYIRFVSDNLKTTRVISYGNKEDIIRRVASFCGAGCDRNAIEFAAENEADVLVSSDLKHHYITELSARGIKVIQLTHYASENYGFNRIYNKIIDGLNVPAAYYCDEDLL